MLCCNCWCSTKWLKDSKKWIEDGYETLSMMVAALVEGRYEQSRGIGVTLSKSAFTKGS